MGVVIQDRNGNVLASSARPVQHIHDPCSCNRGTCHNPWIPLASQIAVSKLVLESDNQDIVTRCSERNQKEKSLMGHLVQKIHQLMRFSPQTQIAHISSKVNSVANKLGKSRLAMSTHTVWQEEVPHHVRPYVHKDSQSCNLWMMMVFKKIKNKKRLIPKTPLYIQSIVN